MMANLTRKLSVGTSFSQKCDTQETTNTNSQIGDTNDIKDQSSPKSKSKLVRRHSISICESRSRAIRKVSAMSVSTTSSNCDQSQGSQQQSGPFSMMHVSNDGMYGKKLYIFVLPDIFFGNCSCFIF